MVSFARVALAAAGFYFLFWILRAVYRLTFHPLSHYPGSRIAAISKPWYEWYWNFYHNGMLLFEVERLHHQLGPVLRIAPNELHINDSDVFLEMTKVGSRFTKDPDFYEFIMFPGTSVGEIDPARHRIRRQVLAPAFSPARVQALAPMVKRKADLLLSRFEDFAAREKPVNMFRATKAFAMDVISDVVFGKALDCIADPEFRNKFIEYLHSTFEMGWTATAFPNLTRFSLSLPEWLSERLFPIPIMEFKKKCIELMDTYLREREAPTVDSRVPRSSKTEFNRSVVIDLLIDPASAKDHSVLKASQLAEEAIMLLSAGNDTTSNAMIIGIYQILKHPTVYERLTTELIKAFPTAPKGISYDEARKLPYLTAVIKETLRFSSPLPGKAPRVVPAEGWTLYGRRVPAKTVVNTSSHLLNRHPAIWSEPDVFSPERWLVDDASHLEKYMTSFYRGSRQCLGKDLAYCEMYTLLANLFRRFELESYETTDADMRWIDLLFTFFVGRNFHARVRIRE